MPCRAVPCRAVPRYSKEEEWEQGMWIERATVGELSTRPLGANPEPPSTLFGQNTTASSNQTIRIYAAASAGNVSAVEGIGPQTLKDR